MKLNELKPTLKQALRLDWVFNLNEMLDTRFDAESWKQVEDTQVGTGKLGDEVFKIYLEPRTYIVNGREYSFINVAFAKLVDGKPTQELQWNAKNASQVVGAVQNALIERVKLYQFDALVFIAADNVEKRMLIYNKIARRKWSHLGTIIENIDLGDGRVLTACLSKELAADDVNAFIEHLKKLGKLHEHLQAAY